MAFLRRYLWLWSLFLTLLFLFLVLRSLPVRSPLPSIKVLNTGHSLQCTRQWNPADDTAPPAHEPVGIGTLRDVREENFYRGGVSTIELVNGSSHPLPAIYDPYPDYNREGVGFHACYGPRGTVLNRQDPEDMVLAYPGLQEGFPFPKYGSYDALKLDGCSCTTRSSRFGAYGYTEPGPDSSGPNSADQASWENVNWKSLQTQCLERNSAMYKTPDSGWNGLLPLQYEAIQLNEKRHSSPGFQTRSAVILRAWHDMQWTENMKHHVRALIMELSLHSGAEYEVFLLTHVKDNDIPLYGPDDEENIQNLKERYIPREFWGITIFFNEQTLESWYPKVDEHKYGTNYLSLPSTDISRPLHQHLQPLQIFSVAFPEFDYYWQLEMDARFTGHAYHFLQRASDFAKQQPRKYLWERNAYFYIPGAHGSWTNFLTTVDESMESKGSIWGPAPPDSLPWLDPVGPEPPVEFPEDDDYEWGAGEEADLITFLPIFDPSDTTWVFSTMVWDIPEDIPRRASPVTMGRFSRLLLRSIHDAQADQGIALVSEMTTSSFALWHGLKAVHVPHPLYADGKWTPKELARMVNRGQPERINSGLDSLWNWNHRFDHILYRMTYMFTAQASEDFYRRWLGFEADPNQYTDGSYHQDPQGRNWFDGGALREDLYGPLCFPSMLLHPVKNTASRKGSDMAVPV